MYETHSEHFEKVIILQTEKKIHRKMSDFWEEKVTRAVVPCNVYM